MSGKIATITAIAGFVMSGRTPVEIGEELKVPEAFARELIHAGKAVRVIPPPVIAEAPKEPAKEPAKDSNDSQRKPAKS